MEIHKVLARGAHCIAELRRLADFAAGKPPVAQRARYVVELDRELRRAAAAMVASVEG